MNDKPDLICGCGEKVEIKLLAKGIAEELYGEFAYLNVIKGNVK